MTQHTIGECRCGKYHPIVTYKDGLVSHFTTIDRDAVQEHFFGTTEETP